ncbi:putative disease resistance protein At3g14460 [Coffea eugenioides]|uniref:putative disease resistance protein At3g14460 n=1 Tax=Coffea eugenioides TaxID=49369 RepID=UPI000F60FAAE|nr:putative disease resistance protein At3g14460 [Coffea eugenioides]XP_027158833.1 putative disease resistance protein At3g14460 [Coffea eugenioides]XP_027158834.1 putative disease resistance protein At3g14460 [Coffea eugenioides]
MNSEKYLTLRQIGREIVKKCQGLPLAVKMLGGLLASKLDVVYWNQVLNSNLWDLPQKKNSILPSLRLSYHHLPPNLKRCFAYCSIFPKGYEFERKNLVLLWMAEGFVQPGEKISMEEVGDEYFSELLSRSFFQESALNRSRYVMHDLINDLAGSVSRISCVRQEENWQKEHLEWSEKVHHFSYIRSKYDVFKRFESLTEVSLRSFLPLGSVSGTQFCFLSNKFPCDFLPKFKCLRVLSMSCYFITELPESIGNLRLLRYLDLSYTRIKSLPESLNVLYNLQTLLLCDCADLNNLPANIGKLINLRHLDISGSGIQAMPIGVENLVSLRSLPEFVLGNVGPRGSTTQEMPIGVDNVVTPPFLPEFGLGIVGSRIDGLRNLSHLQGSLSLSGLENVDNLWDAKNANLKGKQKLTTLVMEWSSTLSELQNDRVATDVLEMLQPHQNLEKLTIKGYNGRKFPTWIGDPSFSKLECLSVTDCKRCRSLPPLGSLPSLKHLYIKGMDAVKSIGAEFYGFSSSSSKSFASLETLTFEEMMEWEEWLLPTSDGHLEVFPSLQELQIEKCPKLRQQLPQQLPSLVKLHLTECEQLSVSLPQIPRLKILNLRGCNYMLLSSNLAINRLASFELHNISSLKHLPEWLLQYMPTLKWLVIVDCSDFVHLARCKNDMQYLTSLQHLVIRNCSMLVSLFEEEQPLPQKLEYLELDSCHSLKKLPHALHSLTALQELIITDCPRLELVPGTTFPSNLQGLVLRGCGLDLLPEPMINNITSLEFLCIGGCLVLSSFPGEGRQVPTTFKQLTIDQCPNLEFLPEGITQSSNISLELLEIFDCPSITSFPAGHLPTTLKVLTIWNCCNLESLEDIATDSMSLESLRIGNCTNLIFLPKCLNKLGCLDYLEIDGCPGIVSFPQGGLPSRSLKKLHILDCENLMFLPELMLSLTSLKELKLSNCPSIASLPDGGFPINLVSLEVKDCENITPLSKWGLHRLASLEKLKIHGGVLDVVFPEWLLPSTLDTLHVGNLPKLKSLSPWLQHLSSLEELKIMECHELFNLPKEGVPPMLSFLEIRGCPKLQQDCEKNWSEIDHIPCISNHL